MNPVVDAEPILVMESRKLWNEGLNPPINQPGWPGNLGHGYATTFISSTLIYGGSIGLSSDWRGVNLVSYLYTNGPIAVPAKTIFYCDNLLSGVHWLRYDLSKETDNPAPDQTCLWFYPDETGWAVRPSTGPVHLGINFRRIGQADLAAQCVPVVMESYNYVHLA